MPTHTPSPRSRTRRLGVALVAGLALLGSLAAAPAASAAEPTADLTLEVQPASVAVGDTVTVTVSGSGVTDLYAYDLVLSVDGDLLAPAGDEPIGPDGGYTSAVAEPGTVTISHTRLGTSPGLSGGEPVVLAGAPLHALAAGTARIELSAVRLVSSTGEVSTLGAGASASIAIAATPTATPTPTTTPAPTATPTAAPTATATATPAPTGSAAAAPGSSDLAATGVDTGAWLISGAVGVALLAAGALFLARRRQGVRG